jgi:hypothetical protein
MKVQQFSDKVGKAFEKLLTQEADTLCLVNRDIADVMKIWEKAKDSLLGQTKKAGTTRGQSPYQYYKTLHKAQLTKQHANATYKQISAMLKLQWDEMDAGEQAPYVTSAEALRPKQKVTKGPVDSKVTKGPVDSKVTKGPVDSKVTKGPDASKVTKDPVDSKVTKGPVDSKVTKGPDASKVTKDPVASKVTKGPDASKVTKDPVDSKGAEEPHCPTVTLEDDNTPVKKNRKPRKKGRSAYQNYKCQQKSHFQQLHPDMNYSDLSLKMKEAWQALSTEEKNDCSFTETVSINVTKGTESLPEQDISSSDGEQTTSENKPTRKTRVKGRSPYQVYRHQQKPEMLVLHKNLDSTAINALLKDNWNSLSQLERVPFEVESNKQRLALSPPSSPHA